MATTTRKDAYGGLVETVERTPELKTGPEAAKVLGISTQRFHRVGSVAKVIPFYMTGTEKNKYPTMLYTPEQVALIATEAARRDGNGRLFS